VFPRHCGANSEVARPGRKLPISVNFGRHGLDMRMKHSTLFGIGFLSVSLGLPDSASCQTSRPPPLSLARPAPSPDETAPPPAIIRASPLPEEDAPSKPATKRSAPPVAAKNATRDTAPPKPAADYDGFSVSIDDDPVAKLPSSPRPTNRSRSRKEPDAGELTDPIEDEQLRRKLTICRDCK
jgi:hypothetical protein